MTIAAIFCIGTGHDHKEDANVLVKLHKACSLQDLGVEGNHTGNAGDNARISKEKMPAASNGGWTWLNEGQNNIGGGMKSQSAANADLVQALPTTPNHVVLIGHSRGAICCLRIAAELQNRMKGNSPKCHIFLYDPVKRLRQGSDWYNRTIHANVLNLKVIAMEDEDSINANVKSFKLMSIKSDKESIAIGQENFLRLPGTHGTATQVMGFPIGQVGYMLALEWLNSLGEAKVPNHAAVGLGDADFCAQYHRINSINPVNYQGIREINDVKGSIVTSSAETNMNSHKMGKRNKVLNKLAGVNPYQGSGFFINRDHARRFCNLYPYFGSYLTGMPLSRDPYKIQEELKVLKRRDEECFKMANEMAPIPIPKWSQ